MCWWALSFTAGTAGSNDHGANWTRLITPPPVALPGTPGIWFEAGLNMNAFLWALKRPETKPGQPGSLQPLVECSRFDQVEALSGGSAQRHAHRRVHVGACRCSSHPSVVTISLRENIVVTHVSKANHCHSRKACAELNTLCVHLQTTQSCTRPSGELMVKRRQ